MERGGIQSLQGELGRRGRRKGSVSPVWPTMALPCRPQVLEYNAVGGKYNRGLTVLQAFRELAEPRKQDAESLQRALTVGWCVELVRRVAGGRGLPELGFPENDPKPVSCLCLCLCVSYMLQSHLDNVNHFRHRELSENFHLNLASVLVYTFL